MAVSASWRKMMCRVATALSLAAFLSMGTFAPAAAQDIGYGGRVEVPDSGVALTLPDDWVYMFPTPELIEQLFGAVEELEDDPLVTEQFDAIRAGEMHVTLIAFAPAQAGSSFSENCTLMSATSDEAPTVVALDLWVAMELTASADDDPAERPSVTYLDLPIGRVATLDYDEDDWAGQTSTAQYLVLGDDSRHWLSCIGEVRPDDDWLSIAETIEFLPDEE
jgi:hypothetical protein